MLGYFFWLTFVSNKTNKRWRATRNIMTAQKFLNDHNIKFPPSLVARVNDNWVTKQYASEFEGMNNDLKCMEFTFISNREKVEQGLAWDISMFAVQSMLRNKKRK